MVETPNCVRMDSIASSCRKCHAGCGVDPQPSVSISRATRGGTLPSAVAGKSSSPMLWRASSSPRALAGADSTRNRPVDRSATEAAARVPGASPDSRKQTAASVREDSGASSDSSTSVPGVSTRSTARSMTAFPPLPGAGLASDASWVCSATATRKPRSISFRRYVSSWWKGTPAIGTPSVRCVSVRPMALETFTASSSNIS